MGVTPALLLALALAGLAGLVGLVGLVGLPVAVARWRRRRRTAAVGLASAFARWRMARRRRRAVQRLNRAVEADPLLRGIDLDGIDLGEFDQPGRQGIEQIAADLRRLGGHRLGGHRPGGGRVTVWHSSLVQAYDDRLRLACRCLGLTEHLGELTGIDLQIERIRVEGELHAAGLKLPAVAAGHPEHLP